MVKKPTASPNLPTKSPDGWNISAKSYKKQRNANKIISAIFLDTRFFGINEYFMAISGVQALITMYNVHCTCNIKAQNKSSSIAFSRKISST